MDARSVSFFVGAGISFNSGVPLFSEFRMSFLKALAPRQKFGTRRELLWDELIANVGIDFFPPEQLFYRLSKLGEDYEQSVISTLLAYSADRIPNKNHFALVEALTSGATVWTTNYDTLIERAASIWNLHCHPLAWPDPPRCEKESCIDLHIYKPHGSFVGSNPEEQHLIFQSPDVLAKLGPEWSNALLTSFADKKVVLAGYKGNDIDLMPELTRVMAESSSTGLWFEFPEKVAPRQSDLLPKTEFSLSDPSRGLQDFISEVLLVDTGSPPNESAHSVPSDPDYLSREYPPTHLRPTHNARATLLSHWDESKFVRAELRRSLIFDPSTVRKDSLRKLVRNVTLEFALANFVGRKVSSLGRHSRNDSRRQSSWDHYLLLNETHGTRKSIISNIDSQSKRDPVDEWKFDTRVSAFSHLKLIGDLSRLDKFVDISEFATQTPSLQGKAVFNVLWVLRNQGRLVEWDALWRQYEERGPYLDPNWTAWFAIEAADRACMLGQGANALSFLEGDAVRFARSQRRHPLLVVDARVSETRARMLTNGNADEFSTDLAKQYETVADSRSLRTPFRRASFSLTWAASIPVSDSNQSLVKTLTDRAYRLSPSQLHAVFANVIQRRHSLEAKYSIDETLALCRRLNFGYGEAIVA